MRRVTIHSLIVTSGFLEGVWLAIGFHPTHKVLEAVSGYLVTNEVDPLYVLLLKILPFVAIAITLYLIYRRGGKLGFIAVALAFAGGFLVLQDYRYSVGLLAFALVLGFIAQR